MRARREKRDEGPPAERYYDMAVRALARSDKSRRQIEQYLTLRGASSDCVAAIARRLEAQGYLNDEAYAARWAERRLAAKPMGLRRMTEELLQHGFGERVVRPIVERLYADTTETDLAVQALAQRRSIKTTVRRGRFLQARGFTGSTIARVLRPDILED